MTQQSSVQLNRVVLLKYFVALYFVCLFFVAIAACFVSFSFFISQLPSYLSGGLLGLSSILLYGLLVDVMIGSHRRVVLLLLAALFKLISVGVCILLVELDSFGSLAAVGTALLLLLPAGALIVTLVPENLD